MSTHPSEHCNCKYCYEARGGKVRDSEEREQMELERKRHMPFGMTQADIDNLQDVIASRQRIISTQIKNTVTIVGDQITVNGITRTLTNPPKNRKERLTMIKKIKANL